MTRVRQQIHSRGEESFRVTLGQSGLRLHLAHLAPKTTGLAGQHRTVLYIHGATFPVALSIGFRFDGHSWMDDLAEAGFDVWGLATYHFEEGSKKKKVAWAWTFDK